MNRTIYIRPEAERMYTRAARLAAASGRSMSELIVGLLAEYVFELRSTPAPGRTAELLNVLATSESSSFPRP